MGAKLEALKEIKEDIAELENKKEIFKEEKIVDEYIRNKYILDYYNEKSESLLESEDFLSAIITMDRLTKNETVKAYIKVCEKLKFYKNVKSALLSEYASKQKVKK